MLVLSRRQGESIIIGDNIRVTVVSLAGDRIRVGIDAPREVSVHRGEIREMIQRERASGSTQPPAGSTADPPAAAPAAGSARAGSTAAAAASARSTTPPAASVAAAAQQGTHRAAGQSNLIGGLRGRLQSIWQRLSSRRHPPERLPAGIPPEDLFFG